MIRGYVENQRKTRLALVLSILVIAAWPPVLFSGELLDLITTAESADANYQAALAAARAVREESKLARAGLLPNVSFQANIAGNTQDIDVAPGAFGLNGRQNFDSENYQLRAQQPLFRFDRWLKLKQVDRRIAQAEAEVAAVHAELVMKVSERFLDVLGYRAELKHSNAELKALLAQLEQTLVRYELGVATEADLLQAQADSDRAAADVIKAQSNVEVALDALAELLNQQVEINAELADDLHLPSLDPQQLTQWSSIAAEQNAAVLAAEMQVEIARFDKNIARAGHLPSVELVGKYGLDSQGGRFGETETTSRSIGVEVQVPIFSGGGVVAQTNIATHKLSEAEFRAEAEKRAAARRAKEAFRRMVMSGAQASAARKSLESSRAARNALLAQYESGARTIAELLEAEQNIFEAQKQLSRATQQYILNSLRLRVASGTLATSDIDHVDSLIETPSESMPEQAPEDNTPLAPETETAQVAS